MDVAQMAMQVNAGPAWKRNGRGRRRRAGRKVRRANPGKGGRGACPPGFPPHLWNDPAFQREYAAYRRRHGTGPVEVRKIKTPNGYPKYLSAWGHAPEIKYDAPGHSNKGRRVHHFGEGQKSRKAKPFLVSSVQGGRKFLAFAGGQYRADGKWITK